MEKVSRFAFDKNINTFSPEGRLFQVEYAIRSSELSGTTCIVTKSFDSVCLVEENKKNLLNDVSPYDSLSFSLNGHTGCVCSGIPGDLGYLRSEIIQEYCNFYNENGFDVSIDQLASLISGKNQALTQQSYTRLLGAKTIFFGIDRETGPSVVKMDPSGYLSSHISCAIGEKAKEFSNYMQRNKLPPEIKNYSCEKIIAYTISILQNILKYDIKAVDIKITVISSKDKTRTLTLEEVDNYLEKLKKINQVAKTQNFE